MNIAAQKIAARSILRYLISVALFIAFIIFVELYLGWQELLRPWTQLPLPTVIYAGCLLLISYLLRALRLFDYFRADINGDFLLTVKLMLQHNMLNNLLPMRTGEISFPVLMARYFSVPMVRSIPALLWFRILDLHTLGLFALAAIASHWLGSLLSIAMILFWLTIPWLFFITSTYIDNSLGDEPISKIKALLKKLITGLPQNARVFWRSWWWTIANWGVKIAVFAWVLLQFIDVPVAGALMGAITGDLSSVLPIHALAGAGTYEAGVVAGLLPYQANAGEALTAGINLHLFLLAASMICGGGALLLKGNQRG